MRRRAAPERTQPTRAIVGIPFGDPHTTTHLCAHMCTTEATGADPRGSDSWALPGRGIRINPGSERVNQSLQLAAEGGRADVGAAAHEAPRAVAVQGEE